MLFLTLIFPPLLPFSHHCQQHLPGPSFILQLVSQLSLECFLFLVKVITDVEVHHSDLALLLFYICLGHSLFDSHKLEMLDGGGQSYLPE